MSQFEREIKATKLPSGNGNTKYQVSAGVKKRFSEMTRAEMDRVVAATLAEGLMYFKPQFEAEAARRPEWAPKMRADAAKVKAIEGA